MVSGHSGSGLFGSGDLGSGVFGYGILVVGVVGMRWSLIRGRREFWWMRG